MKPGRFRKGKKAFKKSIQGKLFNRYNKFLLRIEANRKAAMRIIQVATVNAMGMAQVKSVQQMMGIDPNQKALKIAQIVIETHISMAKIYNS